MARQLILGTAGHIDHGKTALVRALTGTDCDRLPEEKARGITIDIGFAKLDLDDVELGIVDVPGHERFVKNMLAGATGIDLAMLIIAADDSIMPQTREHFEILKLLGIPAGVIVLTKADLVDETTCDVVKMEVEELVKDSFLAHAPVIVTSAHTGLGISELKSALRDLCHSLPVSQRIDWFRMAIDRVFVRHGHGTVVTGSPSSGSVRVNDVLEWHKGDGTSEPVRIRAINNHGKAVEEVHHGQRAALNLAGLSHTDVHRGQELARVGYLRASRVLTVRLSVSNQHHRAIKHRLPIRLHMGTAEILATISLLDSDRVKPGESALAQLFLEHPATAIWGQPFVIRDSSAEQTLGGGQILQPVASKLRRRQMDAIEKIEELTSDDAKTRITTAAWFAGYDGFQIEDLVRSTGLPPDRIESELELAQSDNSIVRLSLSHQQSILVHTDRITELGERILVTLADLHSELPLFTNHDRQKVLARLDYLQHEPLIQAVIDQLIRQKRIVGDSKRIARADFKPVLSVAQRKIKDKIIADHLKAGFTPPEMKEFVNVAAGNASLLKEIVEVAAAEGFLVRLSEGLFLHSDHDLELRQRVRERLQDGVGATVAEIRDLLGTTRKYAVPLCEYLDRIGLTRRDGDLRVLSERETKNPAVEAG